MNFLTQKNQCAAAPISLKNIFLKQKEIASALQKMPVELLILHGSVAQNKSKILSDVDFAVLFKNDSYKLGDVTKVQSLLCQNLEREDIDLAVLNKATPLLCMQVLTKGKVLYEMNAESFARFREQTIRRYLQTKYLRTQFYRYQQQAILGKV